MSTSGTYSFLSSEIVELIEEAYSRIPTSLPVIDNQAIDDAKRSMNCALSSWMNRGLNLWTVKRDMIALNPGQAAYDLPDYTCDVLDATIRTSNRNLGGTPASSAGGTASYAFDGLSSTACTQTSTNGNISYQWSSQYTITLVGVQSNVDRTYNLVFEYSNDNTTWVQVGTSGSQTFTASILDWFVVDVSIPGTYFRVRETDGAILNIQELYFNSAVNDTPLSIMSRADYDRLPQKYQQGRPSQYCVDKQVSARIFLYQTPSSLYNTLFISRTRMIQDVGALVNAAEIPARFIEALIAETAFRLSVKDKVMKDLNRMQFLKQLAIEEFALASKEDTEKVSMYIYPSYWTQR